jgi:subtilisin family serine protease
VLLAAAAFPRPAAAADHVPGRLIVGTRHDADPIAAARTLQFHRAAVRRHLPALNADLVEVPEDSIPAILQSLRQSGLYAYVEPDYYAHTAAGPASGPADTPNDPAYPLQWHLPVIQAPQAWSITTGSASVPIAVIDSGVDALHPDLATKLLPGWSFLTNTATITDTVGHGTAVAGVAAAATNNNLGISGVTWGGMVMPLIVVDDTEYASYSNIAQAIQYAADHGVRIINISAGGPSASTLLQSAVDYAWSKGAVVFAAAMNNASSAASYPAACNHAVAVSATDDTDHLASFSSFGNWVTLAAPGTAILSTSVGGGTQYWYGTSFSTPIAAGVAALALSVNPSLTADALVKLMKQNTDDLGTPGFDSSFGSGRVNAYKTVIAAQKSLTAIAVTVTPNVATLVAGQTVLLSATVTGSASPITWSLGSSAGSISTAGLYTAPASIGATQTVTAIATVGGVSASATITLNRPAQDNRPAPPAQHPAHPW